MSPPKKSRKSYEELVDTLIEALPVRSFTTIEEISRKTGSSWETVYRWIKLVTHIQSMPRVEEMKSPIGKGKVYSRERRKGE